jgi:hypothetical protein
MTDLLKTEAVRGNTEVFFYNGGYYLSYHFSGISAISFYCADVKMYEDGK